MPSLEIDAYVLDTLLPDLVGHDRKPSAFLVYLYLWRHTRGHGRTSVAVSYRTMAADIGLSKAAAQAAVRRLRARRLVAVRQRTPTSTPVYRVLRPWHRPRASSSAPRVRPA